MSFPQITTLTSYSLLQSTIQIPDYVKLAKELGYQILGLTDCNNLYGALEFVETCQKEQVKPILGLYLHYQSLSSQ